MKKGTVLELDIIDIAFGGKGIAKIETEQGQYVLFTPNSLPGQKIKARVVKKKKKYAECKLIEVIQASESEIDNDFQQIPGAPFSRLPIEQQEHYKKQTTFELYKRIGKIENIEDLFDEFISSPQVWHYRNKMEYSFAAIRYDLESKEELDDFGLGFKHRGTWWSVENLDGDSGLFDKELEESLKTIRQFCINSGLPAWHAPKKEGFFRYLVVRKSYINNGLLINFVTSSAGIDQFDMPGFVDLVNKLLPNRIVGILHTLNDDIGDRVHPNDGKSSVLYGQEKITEELLGLTFEVSMQSFFQTNPKCAERLYQKTIDYVLENKDYIQEDVLMDLFCGTGTIAQLLANQTNSGKIIGVDLIPEAIKDAEENAKRNNVKSIEYYAEDVGKFLKNHPEYQGNIKTIIIDPPRAGIAPKTLKKVIDLNANRIVYVSCNPSTQARDTQELTENGYELKKIALVDQFPHTGHVEAIALFELRD